jgi:hypothetical protein
VAELTNNNNAFVDFRNAVLLVSPWQLVVTYTVLLVGEPASYILYRFIRAESRKLNIDITLFTVTGICEIIKACPFYNGLLINYGPWPLFQFLNRIYGAHGSVVGRRSMLQAGRWRVRFSKRSLDFSVNLILPAALWS